ncbi:HVO_0476 family zinc finger protein [Methanocaldococcus villosus]|uniref:HVO_0476 family zinc finger protein n=1 Tax=Methanocaldococcus villosus TaxID=667126 RepID=UPI00036D975B|nr:HVO_0476 family zinc finger protein [Methanocaldococcus villosus]
MERINEICENCGHEEMIVVKKKEFDRAYYYLLKCPKCGYVKEISDKIKLSQAKLIISRYDISVAKVINIPEDQIYKVGDVIEHEGEEIEITKIETPDEKRSALGKEIKVIWGKSLSIPKKLGITINDGNRTYSIYIFVPKDFEFEMGKVYKINEGFFRLKKIKKEKGFSKKAKAKDIVRLYGEVIKPMRRYVDLTEYYRE